MLPPEDQRHIPRLSVIYFSRPGKYSNDNANVATDYLDDDTLLRPIESPVIQREGDKSQLPPNNALTAGEWVQARYNHIPDNYAASKAHAAKREKMIIGSIEVKSYA
jgi:hypothetical protein